MRTSTSNGLPNITEQAHAGAMSNAEAHNGNDNGYDLEWACFLITGHGELPQ